MVRITTTYNYTVRMRSEVYGGLLVCLFVCVFSVYNDCIYWMIAEASRGIKSFPTF